VNKIADTYTPHRGRTKDIAYGYTDTLALAEGKLDRNYARERYGQQGFLFPDPKSIDENGKYTRELDPHGTECVNSADTWSFVAAGIFFTVKCGRTINKPVDCGTSSKPVRSDDCAEDFVVWDEQSVDDDDDEDDEEGEG
jgi:hypothetical protein